MVHGSANGQMPYSKTFPNQFIFTYFEQYLLNNVTLMCVDKNRHPKGGELYVIIWVLFSDHKRYNLYVGQFLENLF